MTTVAPASSFNAALAIQREMALRNALIAQRTPISVGNAPIRIEGPAVVINLSGDALLFLARLPPPVIIDNDANDAFLIAELLQTLVAVNITV